MEDALNNQPLVAKLSTVLLQLANVKSGYSNLVDCDVTSEISFKHSLGH